MKFNNISESLNAGAIIWGIILILIVLSIIAKRLDDLRDQKLKKRG